MIISFPSWLQSARATTLQPLTLGQLTRLSSVVARGVVISKEVVEDDRGSIWSTYHIQLQEVWRGSYAPADIIKLTLRGGVIGEGVTLRGQEIPGQPYLTQGEEGVFFLERTAQGQLVFTGMGQGWFSLSQKAGVAWLNRSSEHRAHLRRAPKALNLKGAPLNLDSLSLATLRRLVTQGALRAPSLTQDPASRETLSPTPSVLRLNGGAQ